MSKKISAFSDDAIGTLDAVGIAEAISAKKISQEEVIEAAIQRAEKVNGELNAIAYKTYDSARAKAKTPQTGLLAGVPTFVKDNEKVKGTPTQMGTLAFKAKPAKKNSQFVNQFFATGLNSLGKSTLPELGLICSTENPKWGITRNPWDTDYTTGGSSSGSAAMVASGVVPIALANDGAGSTRIPASCCGLVGLKPTRGRLVNFDGSEILPVNIGFEGVVTRTVRDTAAFYASAEKHFRNPKLPELGFVREPNKKKLKILFFENVAAGKFGHQDEDVYSAIEKTAAFLSSLGHEVERKTLPVDIDLLFEPFLNYYGLFSFLYSNFSSLVFGAKMDKSQLEPFTTGLSKQFRKNIFNVSKGLKTLKEAGAKIESNFANYDLVMSPVVAHKTPKIGHFSVDLPYSEISSRAVAFAPFTGMQNITGVPGISLPLAESSDGMPIGVHFSAPFGQDKFLLEFAYEMEQTNPWKFIYQN